MGEKENTPPPQEMDIYIQLNPTTKSSVPAVQRQRLSIIPFG